MPDNKKIGSALVIGAGIGGMQASLDLAESGLKVYLLDTKPSIGGVMSQLDKTFPTNDCAMCMMSPRLVEIGRHKDIEIITLGEIEDISGEPGNFKVKIKKKPRYVDENKCTGCGSCMENCPVHNQIYTDLMVSEIKLQDKDLNIIFQILERYNYKKEFIISILQDINANYNYLPEAILRFLSQKLNIPFSQIYNIATFYTAFSLVPKGKYKINVCLGTACHVRGASKILESFKRELQIDSGETTKDMKFSLEGVRCLGCCGLAPVVTINDDLYGKLTQTQIPKIIKKYIELNKKEEVSVNA